MFRVCACLLFGAVLTLSSGVEGQEPKKEQKKDEPTAKYKGQLPANWKKLGLTDQQIQDVYKIQGKYNEEIDKLEAKIKEIKSAMDKERRTVLTAEQKKRLEEILLGKDK